MKIKSRNKSKHLLPAYTTEHSTGMDIRASIEKDIILGPFLRALESTGLNLENPAGYEIPKRPRNSLAINKRVMILNSPGTINADSRGERGFSRTGKE